MKKKTKKITKIILLPITIILLGNAIFYMYCYLTPKLEINKSQSYYLYDNESKLVFGDNDWIPLNKISNNFTLLDKLILNKVHNYVILNVVII